MALNPTPEHKGLMWVIIRHRVQISRVPVKGERIRVETWPMPTTRVAYPRSVVAYDMEGRELFRSITLWVLMDRDTRAMVLPGKSGIMVPGILRGNELPSPNSLAPVVCSASVSRRVCFTDLDVNNHMNNTRYLEWAMDLLPSGFHGSHVLQDATMCYLGEAREGDVLHIFWELTEQGLLRMDIQRREEDREIRIFTADLHYGI
jgi:acyl-ACP thioesterase